MYLLNCFCDGCGACEIGSGGATDGDRWRMWTEDNPHWFRPPPHWLVLMAAPVPLLACSDPCARKLAAGARPIGAEAMQQQERAAMAAATALGHALANQSKGTG